MTEARVALTGKTLRGKILFSAAKTGSLLLKQGGAWRPDEYQATVTPLPRQVDQVDVTTIAALTLYTITIDGKVYSFTSDATPTVTEIRDGLIAAILAASPANGVTPAIFAASILSITGIAGGVPHAVSAGVGLTLTSGVDAVPVFGAFKEHGRLTVKTATVFTGAFDVTVNG